MLDLSNDQTNALAGNDIWPVRLVDIQIGDTTYYISDHYQPLTISGNVYQPNGRLLSIDNVSNKLEADESSIEIGLSAIETTFRKDILAADSIGGQVNIYRNLLSTSTGAFLGTSINIFKGIIYSVVIAEDVPDTFSGPQDGSTFTAIAEVRSTTYRLTETPGRLTNDVSQKRADSGDDSMEFVPALNGVNFHFGGSA